MGPILSRIEQLPNSGSQQAPLTPGQQAAENIRTTMTSPNSVYLDITNKDGTYSVGEPNSTETGLTPITSGDGQYQQGEPVIGRLNADAANNLGNKLGINLNGETMIVQSGPDEAYLFSDGGNGVVGDNDDQLFLVSPEGVENLANAGEKALQAAAETFTYSTLADQVSDAVGIDPDSEAAKYQVFTDRLSTEPLSRGAEQPEASDFDQFIEGIQNIPKAQAEPSEPPN